MDVSITKYYFSLSFALIFCPLLEIAAGALLIAAAKHLSKLNASRKLITALIIVGAVFLLYTIITTARDLYWIVPVLWPSI